MRTLLLVGVAAAVLHAATTTVMQNVVGPDGTPAGGQVFIRITSACQSGADYVGERTVQVTFTGGAFSVTLVPNDSCVPSGTSYTVTWMLTSGQQWTETWIVPTSASPVSVDSVVVSRPPNQNYVIQWQQMGQNGASAGQAPVWSGSAWVPGYVTGTGAAWGTITGTLSSQTDLSTALAGKEANLGNPSVSGYVLSSTTAGVRSWVQNGSGGSGTVTSVGLSLPNIFSVSGSPVTTSGTLSGTLATQTANYVWAGPTSGVAAAPAFRALVAADIPALNYQAPITTGTTAQYFRGDLSLATFPTTWAWANLTGVPASFNAGQILGATIPALATGNLRYNGTSLFWDSAASGGVSGTFWANGTNAASSYFAGGTYIQFGLVFIPQSLTGIGHMYINVPTVDPNVSDFYAWGIYTIAGNVVCSVAGTNLTATGITSAAQSACREGSSINISPGYYLEVVTGNASTAKYSEGSSISPIPWSSLDSPTGAGSNANLPSSFTMPSSGVSGGLGPIYFLLTN